MQVILRHCPICSQDSSSVMAAAANRRTINAMIGSGFAAAFAAVRRRSPFCRPFSPPTDYSFIARSQALQRRFLEGRSWEAAAPTVKDPIACRSLHAAPMVQKPGFSQPPFSFCARRSGLSARGSPEQRFSCTIRCPCWHTVFRFSPGSALADLERTAAPPSSPGKRAAFR